MTFDNARKLAAALSRDIDADMELVAEYLIESLSPYSYAKGTRFATDCQDDSHEQDILLTLWPEAGHDADGKTNAKAEYASALWQNAALWMRVAWMERKPKLSGETK